MNKTLLTLAVLGLLVASLPGASAVESRPPIVVDLGQIELCPEGNPDAVLNYCIIIGSQPVTANVPTVNENPPTQPFCVVGDFCPGIPKADELLVNQPVTVGVPTVEKVEPTINPQPVVDLVCFQTELC